MKTCSKCKQDKADEDFEIRDASGRRRAQCRACRKARLRGVARVPAPEPAPLEPSMPVVWPAWGGPVSDGALAWRV